MVSRHSKPERFLRPVRPSRKQGVFPFTLAGHRQTKELRALILTGRGHRDRRAVGTLSGGAGDLEPESVRGPRLQAFHHMLGRVAPRREGDRGEEGRSWRQRPLELLEGRVEGFLSPDSPSTELTWMAGRRSPWAELLGARDKPGVRSCPQVPSSPVSLPQGGRAAGP